MPRHPHLRPRASRIPQVSASNRKGLTYEQWRAAAGKGDSSRAHSAWLAGEDPTEHRGVHAGYAAGRGAITRFFVEERRGLPAAIALDAKGHVVNAINGDKSETVASVLAAARKHWPHAKLVERPEFHPGPDGRYVAGKTKAVSMKGLAKGKTKKGSAKK